MEIFIILIEILAGIFSVLLVTVLSLLLFRTHFEINGDFIPSKKLIRARTSIFGKSVQADVVLDILMKKSFFRISFLKFKILQKPIERKTEKKIEKTATKIKKTKSKKGKTLSLFSVKEWIYLGREALRRFFKILRAEETEGDMTVGLGNPALTGIFLGSYYSLASIIPAIRHITITPNFVERVTEGKVLLSGSMRLVQIIPIVIFIFWKILKRKRQIKLEAKHG